MYSSDILKLDDKIRILDNIFLMSMNDLIVEVSKKCLEQGYLLEIL